MPAASPAGRPPTDDPPTDHQTVRYAANPEERHMARPTHYEDERVVVRKLCVGPLENNAYLVACRNTGEAVLIDAAAEPSRILAAAGDLHLTAILTTHGHWDHVQAVAGIREEVDIPFRIHSADAAGSGHDPDEPLGEGVVQFGDVAIETMVTPGHTEGSMCFALPGLVFTGDTLFPGGPGATSDRTAFDTILRSISDRLLTLDGATLIMPGHGLDTTVGTERPHLGEWRARGW